MEMRYNAIKTVQSAASTLYLNANIPDNNTEYNYTDNPVYVLRYCTDANLTRCSRSKIWSAFIGTMAYCRYLYLVSFGFVISLALVITIIIGQCRIKLISWMLSANLPI